MIKGRKNIDLLAQFRVDILHCERLDTVTNQKKDSSSLAFFHKFTICQPNNLSPEGLLVIITQHMRKF